ncbi:hypothetical protein [Streptomyces hoynatensis]|uniref:hypothetical protein n=1 Tax=Streptomyces hoynatensis TaxID=1141874 RepID=UPI001319D65D|nr:hypothetical protein [Streptomyces hoynatensis]
MSRALRFTDVYEAQLGHLDLAAEDWDTQVRRLREQAPTTCSTRETSKSRV